MTSSKNHIRIHVIGMEGSIWSTEVKSSTKIEKLKSAAISYFHSLGLQSSSQCGAYKLISVSKKTLLSGEKSLTEEDLRDNDEVLLVACRSPIPKVGSEDKSLRGPSAAEIVEATKHLEKRNCVRPQTVVEGNVICFVEKVQNEVQKILISLIEAAARLLSPAPDGMQIFNLLNEKLKAQREPALGNPSVKQLTDMGFSQQRVLKALKIKKMNIHEATEWLLQQGSDSEDDEEEASTSQSQPQTVVEAFQGLLRSLLSAKKPDSKHVENLKEMGFEEGNIIQALRVTHNNPGAACAWLIQDGREKGHVVLEQEQGLDPDGPIFKAIMTNPIIQLNLTKPKVLLAFLSMLENPASADVWINDDDTSPVLNQIYKTYNTEKHAKPSNDTENTPPVQFDETSD